MTGFTRRAVLGVVAALGLALPAAAADEVARLARALMFPEVVDTLRVEGLAYGEDIDTDMLGGAGGAHFAAQVSEIYDTGRILATMETKLGEGLTAEEMDACLDFLESPVGQRILRLEVTARDAMTDTEVADFAKESYAKAEAEGLPRLQLIARFIEVNALIDHNVAGALSSNYRFFRGLSDASSEKMSEGEIMDRVWEQEAEVRRDTVDWMNGFLFMAYGPLSDEEMRAYVDFSETPAGQSLNKALFAGFDSAFDRIYYELGQAAGRVLNSRDI
ncbi:DUF2059 domain-containing protein [Seohaeicola nanhaiensis]|uniref:DUF2059 domain-containing protein n=1 Tax=Seohaeicola nanhaiensis TaxID=1387282 RepID=A0ABV9KP61_9RHOB